MQKLDLKVLIYPDRVIILYLENPHFACMEKVAIDWEERIIEEFHS